MSIPPPNIPDAPPGCRQYDPDEHGYVHNVHIPIKDGHGGHAWMLIPNWKVPAGWVSDFRYPDGSFYTRAGYCTTSQIKHSVMAMAFQIANDVLRFEDDLAVGNWLLFTGSIHTWPVPPSP